LLGLTGQDYTATGKPRIAWDDQAARDELVSALVGDALALLAALDVEKITAEGGKAADAVALLALVAGQDVEPAEDSDGTDGRWRIARRTAPDRMISTVDPDARHAHKTRERKQDGFKAHVVVEPDTGLTTMCELTKPNGTDNSDATVGAALVTTDPTLPAPTEPAEQEKEPVEQEKEPVEQEKVEVLGDSAYATGAMLAVLHAMGWLALLKPWPLKPAVEGGFTIDDYSYDPDANTLTCPAGVTRKVSDQGRATFKTACRECPMRQQCTTAAAGRVVLLGEHHQLQREHRKRAADEGFQAVYKQHRPMVERSIAWLTRGNRRVPYRGVEKNNDWLHRRVAALNLRRLLNMGLTVENVTWVLA